MEQTLGQLGASYYRLPSQNSKIQDLQFEINKQMLEMVNSREITNVIKAQQLESILENIQKFSISANEDLNVLKSNIIAFPDRKIFYGNNTNNNLLQSGVIALPTGLNCLNDLASVGRGDSSLNNKNAEISNLTDSFTKTFLPSLSIGTALGIVLAAFKIAMEFLFAPLVILVLADLLFNGIADLYTKEKEGRMFKKMIQYFSIFFLLTGLIILELILLYYDIMPSLKGAIEHHVLVFGFLGATFLMCIKNIKVSLNRLELPVTPFTKIMQVSLAKFAPDAIKWLEKVTPKKDDDKNN
jgi:hypothetical protein